MNKNMREVFKKYYRKNIRLGDDHSFVQYTPREKEVENPEQPIIKPSRRKFLAGLLAVVLPLMRTS